MSELVLLGDGTTGTPPSCQYAPAADSRIAIYKQVAGRLVRISPDAGPDSEIPFLRQRSQTAGVLAGAGGLETLQPIYSEPSAPGLADPTLTGRIPDPLKTS